MPCENCNKRVHIKNSCNLANRLTELPDLNNQLTDDNENELNNQPTNNPSTLTNGIANASAVIAPFDHVLNGNNANVLENGNRESLIKNNQKKSTI